MIAEEVGVRRAPTLMLGPVGLRDAFTYGTPRHYRVALPPAAAVRWRDARLFDPVMRHELAHLRHHDVPLAWLARSVWWVLAPLLLLPVVVGVAEGDTSLLPGYAWRAVVLAAVVQVVSSALLRSREHDADLRAAQTDPEAIAGVVGGAREPAGRSPWRRALARHPSPAARLAVLERPERHTRVTFLDGAVTGFLAGLVIPLVVATVTPLLSGTEKVDLAWVAAALVAGPLIAGSVGLGLCRAALVNRLRGATAPVAPVAAGLAAGSSSATRRRWRRPARATRRWARPAGCPRSRCSARARPWCARGSPSCSPTRRRASGGRAPPPRSPSSSPRPCSRRSCGSARCSRHRWSSAGPA